MTGPAQDLEEAVVALLAAHWGEPLQIGQVRVRAGLHQAVLVAEVDGPAGRQRIAATGGLQPDGLAPAVQAELLLAAEAAGVAVPAPLCADDGDGPAGRPLLVTTAVPGARVPAAVAGQVKAGGHGKALVQQLGWALGAVHAAAVPAPLQALPALQDWQPAAALVSVQQACAGLLQPSPTFALALQWLAQHRPADSSPVWLHGDLRPGNLVVGDDGLRAVLGWHRSRIGDPMADLAWACLRCWRGDRPDAEVAGWWSREPLVEGYAEAGGAFDVDRFHWWKVLGTLQRGLDLAERGRAHVDGRLPGVAAAAAGRRVALQEYDLLTLLG